MTSKRLEFLVRSIFPLIQSFFPYCILIFLAAGDIRLRDIGLSEISNSGIRGISHSSEIIMRFRGLPYNWLSGGSWLSLILIESYISAMKSVELLLAAWWEILERTRL